MLFIILAETNFLKNGKQLGNVTENGKNVLFIKHQQHLKYGMGLTLL